LLRIHQVAAKSASSFLARDNIALARLFYRPSVRPSVCLSHGESVKQLKLWLWNFHHCSPIPLVFAGWSPSGGVKQRSG